MTWGVRSDALYGLVSTMDRAALAIGKASLPTLYLYGAHDQIIPKEAALPAAARLKPIDRSAYYAKGWHLMMRDKQGPVVWGDILTFIRDPAAPLPSGAPKIPTARAPPPQARAGL
jgi:alpha-beta hydrolase superfamily lysophospholipase